MFQSLQIHYQTGPFITAPHAYEVDLHFTSSKNGLEVIFTQTFIHREDLDKQEIEAEGFTENDDFSWKGTLPEIWNKELNAHLSSTAYSPELSEQLFLKVVSEKGNKQGVPQPESEWIALAELLTQACLEAGEKEHPMELVLGKLEKSNFYEKARLVWSFESRSLLGQILYGETKQFSDSEWIKSQENLKKWIEAEAQENDLYQVPGYKGLFWLLNGEVWLTYGNAPEIPAIQWIESELGM